MVDTAIGETRSAALADALYPIATILIWSGNTIVTKASAGVIAPESISFYRWLIAFAVLTPLVASSVWRHRALAFAYLPKLFVLGMLGMVIYQCLAYVAAETTTAVNMGVLVASMPLISVLLASALAGEGLTSRTILGGLVSLVGLVFLAARGDLAELVRSGVHIGDVLMLVAIVANSFYGVLLRRWSLALPMWPQLWWQIGFAVLVLFPLWLMSDISPVTAESLPLVLFAALPTSLLAPFLWMQAIRKLGAARSALYINLVPVFVATLAWLVLGEALQGYHLLGGGLALLGVAVGVSSRRPIPKAG
ncbi:DMT family transporter [Ciceribacter sp. L1K22]|uniref:DMT family transporter n=1 Tax=Ciceribacter sp. L1K22 TaxID=2820275 RepID=UPI001ABDB45F|nr:DMT family transporter [Ciceribacter sp. L1K22]MBO3759545.1 DMT family transporter [Ciceribacter sp. L1K22]